MSAQNERGQGVSHAADSQLPQKAQEAVCLPRRAYSPSAQVADTTSQVPSSVEHKVPDALHDTGSNPETGKVSHATGKSIVPQTLQEGLPEKVEKIVPNAIHDTKGAKFSNGSVGK
jgi:hypothetical protein